MKIKLLLLFACVSLGLLAQNTGTISGKVTDKDFNDEPLPFVNIMIKDTKKGTTSDINGLYELSNLEPGSYKVVFSFVGYKTQEVPATVVAGKVTKVNLSMTASAATLDEVVVKTTARKDSESALLLDQKQAIEIKQSIGAEELSRKGVGDAEAAVTKVSGVSKSEGAKNVFVRGLGDRYNSTSLNGLPLPSEDPKYKNIALDFFSTDIIQTIDINKVFNTRLYGDLAGANIDIKSKEMYGSDILMFSLGTGANFNVFGKDIFVPNGAKFMGTGISADSPITDLTQYTFNDGLNTQTASSFINSSASIYAGKRFSFNNGSNLSVFATLGVNDDYQYREGVIAQFNSDGDQGTQQDFEQSFYSVSQLGLVNFKYTFGDNNFISLNNSLIRKVTQSVGEYLGENSRISDNLEDEDFIRRQQTNKNNLYVNQLLSSFKINDKINLALNASYNIIRGSEPDRRTNSFIRKTADNEDFFRATAGSAGLNHRFFSDLEEDDIAANLVGTYKFLNNENTNNIISVGVDFRQTDRTFTFRQFNFQFVGQEPVDIDNPDALFNQQSLDNGIFEIVTDRGRNAQALIPFFYKGDRNIIAGFVDGNYDLTEQLTLTAGLRFERISQEVDWDTSLTSSVSNPTIDPAIIDKNYILPSVSFKYNFNEDNILRVAASQSYIMPQFKEVAPFLYEDVNSSEFGNEFLIPSDIFNFDIKYDYFFGSSELVSFAIFYKNIQNPINRVQVNSAGNDFSFVNFGNANVAGLELEIRKELIKIQGINNDSDIQFGLNASYLYTNQELDDTDRDQLTVRATNDEDQLQGASPFVGNIDITYVLKGGNTKLTSSIIGNYFSNRIYSIGTAGNNNFVEKSRFILDFVNQYELDKNLSLSLSVKNILDPDFEIFQEVQGQDRPVDTFKRGVNASAGITYKF